MTNVLINPLLLEKIFSYSTYFDIKEIIQIDPLISSLDQRLEISEKFKCQGCLDHSSNSINHLIPNNGCRYKDFIKFMFRRKFIHKNTIFEDYKRFSSGHFPLKWEDLNQKHQKIVKSIWESLSSYRINPQTVKIKPENRKTNGAVFWTKDFLQKSTDNDWFIEADLIEDKPIKVEPIEVESIEDEPRSVKNLIDLFENKFHFESSQF